MQAELFAQLNTRYGRYMYIYFICDRVQLCYSYHLPIWVKALQKLFMCLIACNATPLKLAKVVAEHAVAEANNKHYMQLPLAVNHCTHCQPQHCTVYHTVCFTQFPIWQYVAIGGFNLHITYTLCMHLRLYMIVQRLCVLSTTQESKAQARRHESIKILSVLDTLRNPQL